MSDTWTVESLTSPTVLPGLVAAAAQIVAVIFAWVTVMQARMVIRGSVAPAWDLGEVIPFGDTEFNGVRRMARVSLINRGAGSARDIKLTFHPKNGQPAPELRADNSMSRWKTTHPGAYAPFDVLFNPDQPIDGVLVVACTTRLGLRHIEKFDVATRRESNNGDWVLDIRHIYK
jgi:hypothetical protein